MFKAARKDAGLSIESAAFHLHIGSRTLTNYENGHSLVPPDVVLRMSEVYEQPRLAARYCAEQCPIGQRYAHQVEEKSLAESVLNLIKEQNDVIQTQAQLIAIAADGVIDKDERPVLEAIMKELIELEKAIGTFKWWVMSELKMMPGKKQNPAPANMVAEKRAGYQTKRAATAAQ